MSHNPATGPFPVTPGYISQLPPSSRPSNSVPLVLPEAPPPSQGQSIDVLSPVFLKPQDQ